MRSRKSYRRLRETMTAVKKYEDAVKKNSRGLQETMTAMRKYEDAVKKNIPEVAENNDRNEEI